MKTELGKKTFKYIHVREEIRRRISEGIWKPASQIPTLNELIKEFKSSNTTVNRVLGELEREGLLVRHQGSGTYVADQNKEPIVKGKTIRLGLLHKTDVLPNAVWGNSVVESILKSFGMENIPPVWPKVTEDEDTKAVWSSHDHNVTVESIGQARLSHAGHPTLQAVREANFDALITISIIEDKWLKELVELGIPAVLVDYAGEELEGMADIVYFDPSSGFRKAVKYMYDSGCRKIHFIGGTMHAATPQDRITDEEWNREWKNKRRIDPDSYLRLNAFRYGMDTCGLPVNEKWIHLDTLYSYRKEDAELFYTYLAELKEDQRPDAVICHNAGEAEDVIRYFNARGLKLLGAGASNVDEVYRYALPIRANNREMGRVGSELVISRLTRPTRSHLRVGIGMDFSIS